MEQLLHEVCTSSHLRVIFPSSTSPRRMSSNRVRFSAMGRSRQGLPCFFSLQEWQHSSSLANFHRI